MIAVVAHTKRADEAHQLMERVGAAYLSMDNGTLGCEQNHRRTWQWLADNNPNEWSTVLEDDARPVPNFKQHLQQALAHTDTDVVSCYLGHKVNNPPQEATGQRAVDNATKNGACWITSHLLLHAVAVSIKTALIPDMLNHTRTVRLPIDEAITHWTRHKQPAMMIGYTNPSLVDHADGEPVILRRRDKMPRPKGRTAYTVGTPHQWNRQHIKL